MRKKKIKRTKKSRDTENPQFLQMLFNAANSTRFRTYMNMQWGKAVNDYLYRRSRWKLQNPGKAFPINENVPGEVKNWGVAKKQGFDGKKLMGFKLKGTGFSWENNPRKQ